MHFNFTQKLSARVYFHLRIDLYLKLDSGYFTADVKLDSLMILPFMISVFCSEHVW